MPYSFGRQSKGVWDGLQQPARRTVIGRKTYREGRAHDLGLRIRLSESIFARGFQPMTRTMSFLDRASVVEGGRCRMFGMK